MPATLETISKKVEDQTLDTAKNQGLYQIIEIELFSNKILMKYKVIFKI